MKNTLFLRRFNEVFDKVYVVDTIDWQKKESARAGMRSKVKRLLKKYHYPPEEAQSALETVIQQCEQWADVESSEYEDYGTSAYVDGYKANTYTFEPQHYSMVAEPEGPEYGRKNNDDNRNN